MAKSLRQRLKAYFSKGAKPTEQQFAEWIDACLLTEEDGVFFDEQGTLEITSDVKIKGDLFVEGQSWLKKKERSFIKKNIRPAVEPPVGAIFLWQGKDIPKGYQVWRGENGVHDAMILNCDNSCTLKYIIKS